jgi:LPXTG-site transpeptidase (sortase) family protein
VIAPAPATRRGLRSAARAVALAVLTTLAIGGCGTAPAPTVADVTTTQVGIPTRVEIPAIDVDVELVPVGLRADGAMQTPDSGLAAWYELGPRPGSPGPAVVLGHVDSRAGPDVFHRLHELVRGDRVTVHGHGGSATFVVGSSEQVAKDRLPYDRIWSDSTDPVLRLITCGGPFDAGTGHYLDNVIVYAHLVG